MAESPTSKEECEGFVSRERENHKIVNKSSDSKPWQWVQINCESEEEQRQYILKLQKEHHILILPGKLFGIHNY